MENICSNIFTDIEEDIIKQINTLKPFDMEPCKAIPKKNFGSEEENNCEKEINLTGQDKMENIDWCKCGCKCKPMATFAKRHAYCFSHNPGARGEHLAI